MEINYDERCDNCDFKYCEAYEEQVYSCMFDFDHCKLTEFEKKKLERFYERLENTYDEMWREEYNGTLTKEKDKAFRKKANAICKEENEYVDTLKKKGKIFYE